MGFGLGPHIGRHRIGDKRFDLFPRQARFHVHLSRRGSRPWLSVLILSFCNGHHKSAVPQIEK